MFSDYNKMEERENLKWSKDHCYVTSYILKLINSNNFNEDFEKAWELAIKFMDENPNVETDNSDFEEILKFFLENE